MLTSHCKETKQPHKKFKVDWFFFWGGYISRYTPPVATALVLVKKKYSKVNICKARKNNNQSNMCQIGTPLMTVLFLLFYRCWLQTQIFSSVFDVVFFHTIGFTQISIHYDIASIACVNCSNCVSFCGTTSIENWATRTPKIKTLKTFFLLKPPFVFCIGVWNIQKFHLRTENYQQQILKEEGCFLSSD